MRQSSNIYDKFDSLRSQDGGDALSFWSVVSIGLAGLLVLVGCYLLFRGLWARALVARAERRGQPPVVDQGSGFDGAPIALHSGPDWLSEEEFLRGSDLDFSHLDLEPGECMGLFWNLDGLRCGCLARVEVSEAQRLIAKVESELLPRGERLSVVIPELQGHVTFCHAIATGHDDPYRVQLEFDDESPPVRMHRRHRLPVTMKVAAARQD
ncbi:MAG: hypothetical protein KDB53_14290, partial [Planctomycetes bacterium]|nr:hypothetical protein [Planctomycetota bacterium]